MWFFYDSTGTRIGVQQGNVTAYYMYNLQGGGGGACMTSIKYNDAGLGGGASEYKDAIMVWDIAGVGTNMGATIGPLSYGIAICDATKAEACGFSLGWGMEIHAVVDYTWLIPLNY